MEQFPLWFKKVKWTIGGKDHEFCLCKRGGHAGYWCWTPPWAESCRMPDRPGRSGESSLWFVLFADSLVEELIFVDIEKQKPQLLCVWRMGGEPEGDVWQECGGENCWKMVLFTPQKTELPILAEQREKLRSFSDFGLLSWQHFYSVILVFVLLVHFFLYW